MHVFEHAGSTTWLMRSEIPGRRMSGTLLWRQQPSRALLGYSLHSVTWIRVTRWPMSVHVQKLVADFTAGSADGEQVSSRLAALPARGFYHELVYQVQHLHGQPCSLPVTQALHVSTP